MRELNQHICEESRRIYKWGKQYIVIQAVFQAFNDFNGDFNKHSGE